MMSRGICIEVRGVEFVVFCGEDKVDRRLEEDDGICYRRLIHGTLHM
jgi:hypothetical protein